MLPQPTYFLPGCRHSFGAKQTILQCDMLLVSQIPKVQTKRSASTAWNRKIQKFWVEFNQNTAF
jgi:hypothetical protein